MTTKIRQSFFGGITGTAAMSAVMMLSAMMGMPKMSPPQMLSTMTGLPIVAGWIMHFIIGTIFAFSYAFLFIRVVRKIRSNILKGVIFGFAAFIFGQIAMAIMGSMLGGMPEIEGSMILIMMGSIIGHIIFGIVVAQFVKEQNNLT